MNWKFLISFAVGLGCYLLVVLVVGFIKRFKNKKLVKADKEKFEGNVDENNSEVNNDKE